MKVSKNKARKSSKTKGNSKAMTSKSNKKEPGVVSKDLLALENQDGNKELFKMIGESSDFKLTPSMNLGNSSKEIRTTLIQPPSDLLERLSNFLPLISKENELLKDEKVLETKLMDISGDIEREGQYIELNLGLGVYDVKSGIQDKVVSCDQVNIDENSMEFGGKDSDIIYTALSDDEEDILQDFKIKAQPDSPVTNKIQLLD